MKLESKIVNGMKRLSKVLEMGMYKTEYCTHHYTKL